MNFGSKVITYLNQVNERNNSHLNTLQFLPLKIYELVLLGYGIVSIDIQIQFSMNFLILPYYIYIYFLSSGKETEDTSHCLFPTICYQVKRTITFILFIITVNCQL